MKHSALIGLALFSVMAALGNWMHAFEWFTHTQWLLPFPLLAGVLWAWIARCWVLRLALLLLLGYHAFWAIPYWKWNTPTSAAEPSLRILIFNCNANNNRYPEMIQQIEAVNPDVLVICEANIHLIDRMKHLHAQYPHRMEVERWPGTHWRVSSGTALWSRFEFKASEVHTLRGAKIQAIHALLKVNGQTVDVFAVHFPSPVNQTQIRQRNAGFQELTELLDPTNPVLILGDLNHTVTAHTMREFLKANRLRSVFRDRGMRATWPEPLYPFGVAIDHILYRGPMRATKVASLDGMGSDHRMLLAEIQLQDLP
jgi:endonuclease/exonuclease/phosphatase (EEP) superfamily protein YafD